MDPEDTYSIAGFKGNLANCIDKVTAGHVVYIANHKRRGRPLIAALVRPGDALAIEAARANAAQAP